MSKRKTTRTSISDGLEEIRSRLREKFGDDIIQVYTEPVIITRISTGVKDLDAVLGGGVPCGRMVELAGNPSAGKTTIALAIMAEAQKQFPDKRCVYVDAEHTLDLEWAQKLGIDLSRFEHSQPEFGEDAIEVIGEYIQSGLTSVIVLDSVAALVPKPERDGEIGAANIGLQARLVAQSMRILSSLLYKQKETVLIFINQKRADLNANRSSFTAMERSKPTGGKALPFYMTSRLEIYKIETLKNTEGIEVGQRVEVKVLKHKIPPGPGGKAKFVINNVIGVDKPLMLLEEKLKTGEILRAGSWYAFSDKTKVQGEEAAKAKIVEDMKS